MALWHIVSIVLCGSECSFFDGVHLLEMAKGISGAQQVHTVGNVCMCMWVSNIR